MSIHGGDKQPTAEISGNNSDNEDITNGAILNLPVNLDDQKSLKSISKTQLVEVIKRLNKELDALKVKPSPSLGSDTQAQTT